jgi:endoglucanase
VPVLPSRPPSACGSTRATRPWALLAAVVRVSAGCSSGPDSSGPEAGHEELTELVQAVGRGLTVGGKPTRLKAVNFTNGYDAGIEAHELLTSGQRSEHDYERVKDLGFNSIRFAFQGTGTCRIRTLSGTGWTRTWSGPGSTVSG